MAVGFVLGRNWVKIRSYIKNKIGGDGKGKK